MEEGLLSERQLGNQSLIRTSPYIVEGIISSIYREDDVVRDVGILPFHLFQIVGMKIGCDINFSFSFSR